MVAQYQSYHVSRSQHSSYFRHVKFTCPFSSFVMSRDQHKLGTLQTDQVKAIFQLKSGNSSQMFGMRYVSKD